MELDIAPAGGSLATAIPGSWDFLQIFVKVTSSIDTKIDKTLINKRHFNKFR